MIFWALKEREYSNHFSILAWRIPWTEEPGGLQSRGSQTVGHDWSELALRWRSWLSICLPIQEMWETRVQSLGWEDLLEKEMATHSSILAWKTPSAEDPGGLQFVEPDSIGHDWAHVTKNHSILRPINKIEHLRHIAQRKLSVNIRSIFSHVSSYLARAGSHTLTSMVSVAVKHSICCHATDIIRHPIVSFDKGIFRSSYYFFSKHNICH